MLDNNTAALLRFSSLVNAADLAGKKEVKLEIKEAKAIAYAITQATIKLSDIDGLNGNIDGGDSW
jgi:hypothetical protein